MQLRNPDAEGAEEALAFAATIYGAFLEACEPTVRHGVGELARRALVSYFKDRALENNAEKEQAGPGGETNV